MTTPPCKIGLLGGSFNPVHLAHIQLAITALTQLGLNEVQLIPAGQPWQKAPLSVKSEHRLRMLQLAITGIPGLTINTIELTRSGASYTIDTLRALPKQSGEQYYWLMGADQLNNFCTWKEWQAILDYVQLVIAKRPNYSLIPPSPLMTALKQHDHSLHILEMPEIDLSSTHIRQKLIHQESTDGLLAPSVQAYIHQHHLYQL